MRLWITCIAVSSITILGVARAATADDEPTPYSIIDRALKAGGGLEKISRFKAVSFKAECVAGDEKSQVSGVFGGSALFRVEIAKKDKDRILLIGCGDSVWTKEGKEDYKESRAGGKEGEFERITWLTFGISLPDQLHALKGKGYKLTIVGDAEVNGVRAVGLRVNHELHPEVLVYFDNESGLPVKSQLKLPPSSCGLEILRNPDGKLAEIYFDKYKDVRGVQHFSHLKIRAGDEELEFRLTEIELLEKVDPETFKKPS
jgi:hypothetical protein